MIITDKTIVYANTGEVLYIFTKASPIAVTVFSEFTSMFTLMF